MSGMAGMTGYELPEVYAWAFNPQCKNNKPLLHRGPTAKDFLKRGYADMSILETGIYRLRGWAFDFRPFLRRFVYKQYGHWEEVYAPNKTALRDVIPECITEIVEVI
jgi:hypothetical protein